MVTNAALKDMLSGLDKQTSYFDQSMNELETIRKGTQPTDLEVSMVFVSPFLLAFALALRITKVTGEIRLERRNNR
jgi:hypothetical protein